MALLGRMRANLNGGGLLIGVDLVKDPGRLHAAYNDAAGVTALFSRIFGARHRSWARTSTSRFCPLRPYMRRRVALRCIWSASSARASVCGRSPEFGKARRCYRGQPQYTINPSARWRPAPGIPARWTDEERLFSLHWLESRYFSLRGACQTRGEAPICAPIWGVKVHEKTVIAGLVVMASTAAFAQSGGQLAVQQGTNTQNYDVPAGSKAQTVIITTRDLKDGESTSPHMHYGVEMTQVVTGTFECYLKGLPMKLIHAGGSFVIPREVPHDCRPQPGSEWLVVGRPGEIRAPRPAAR